MTPDANTRAVRGRLPQGADAGRFGFMQFTQITDAERNMITGYAPDHVAVNGVRYAHSLILRPDRLLPSWPVTDVGALSLDTLAWVHTNPPEILLLGTGQRQTFPERALWRELRAQPWGLEIMDTAAACRTYNLIMAEGRMVAAALIVGG
jgi:uncharacterized protein